MTVNKENRTHLVTVLLGHFDLHCKKWMTLFLIIYNRSIRVTCICKLFHTGNKRHIIW